MQSKQQMEEFLDSLLAQKEWNQEQREIIAQIRTKVKRSKTIGHLKEALIEGIKLIPYISDWINPSGGV